MSICQADTCDHYGCNLARKGISISPRATPSRVRNPHPTPHEPPSFNKQIMYDERPGGTRVPFLDANGDVIRRKQWGEKRHEYESILRQRHHATTTP